MTDQVASILADIVEMATRLGHIGVNLYSEKYKSGTATNRLTRKEKCSLFLTGTIDSTSAKAKKQSFQPTGY